MHVYSPCIKTGSPLPLVGSHNQLEGNPPGQTMMKGDDPKEGKELLERDPEKQDQQVEQCSNSNAAEEDEVGVRQHPVGEGGSEESLNIATEESSGGLNPAQSVMVVSFRSTDYKTHEFISALVVLFGIMQSICMLCTVDSILSCTVDSILSCNVDSILLCNVDSILSCNIDTILSCTVDGPC